jgi:hypothetical protein
MNLKIGMSGSTDRQELSGKLDWLRAAVKEGVEAMDRGDFTALDTEEKVRQFVRD